MLLLISFFSCFSSGEAKLIHSPILTPGLSSPAIVTPETTIISTPTPKSTSTSTPISTPFNSTPITTVNYPIKHTDPDLNMIFYEYKDYVSLYRYRGSDSSIIIPDTYLDKNVIRIENDAFFQNKFLQKVTLPSGLTYIGNAAFFSCSSIKGPLNLPPGLNYIGNNAFWGCSGLTGSLSLPKGLVSIGDRSFSDCSGFTGPLVLPLKL